MGEPQVLRTRRECVLQNPAQNQPRQVSTPLKYQHHPKIYYGSFGSSIDIGSRCFVPFFLGSFGRLNFPALFWAGRATAESGGTGGTTRKTPPPRCWGR